MNRLCCTSDWALVRFRQCPGRHEPLQGQATAGSGSAFSDRLTRGEGPVSCSDVAPCLGCARIQGVHERLLWLLVGIGGGRGREFVQGFGVPPPGFFR